MRPSGGTVYTRDLKSLAYNGLAGSNPASAIALPRFLLEEFRCTF